MTESTRLPEVPVKKRSNCRSFVGANQTARWKLSYFVLATLIFLVAAWHRFSLPQYPVADTDFGYLWPALSKLTGNPFQFVNAVNFLYPGFVYVVLRMFGDFRAIAALQHILGLAAGGLFLASWNRLADFFQKPQLNRRLHQAIGLFGAAIYLLSNNPIVFESQIRADAVCMFFQALTFWLAIQFFYYRAISKNALRTSIYAIATGIDCLLLASLKPSFALASMFVLAAVALLTMSLPRILVAKLAFLGTCFAVVAVLSVLQNFFSRDDDRTKIFLPETLFAVHAKIIQAQMSTDLKEGTVDPSSREWLRIASDDLQWEIQRAHEVNLGFFPRLGFGPDRLMSIGDPILGRWRQQMGDAQFRKFLKYWYFHSLVRRPLAFGDKIAQQLLVFYSSDCPAFSDAKTVPLGPTYYVYSFAALSKAPFRSLLSKVPAGSAFLQRTDRLRFSQIGIQENRLIRICNHALARSYLAILLITLSLAMWLLVRQADSGGAKWPAFLVLLFYSANFGNVLGISIIHIMEVGRYSTVQFIAALFAQLWAIRWLIEIVLNKLNERKISCALLHVLDSSATVWAAGFFCCCGRHPEIRNGRLSLSYTALVSGSL